MNKIIPIEIAKFQTVRKSNFTYMHNADEIIQPPVLVFLIITPDGPVLADTGCSGPDWAAKHHHPIVETEEIIPALKKAGCSPSDIKIVINTHLHWDHCFNNSLFSEAKFIVQAEELRYAKNPLPIHYTYYESEMIGLTPPWRKIESQIELITGEKEIAPGVRTIPLPGHTPGFQGVYVESDKGNVVLAGCSLPLYDNWQPTGYHRFLPSGIHTDLCSYYESLNKLAAMQVTLIPGHDSRVFEHWA